MSNSFQFIGRFEQFNIPTVFLPGWGFDGRILRLLHPAPAWSHPAGKLDPETFEADLCHFLETNKLQKARIIGWSMGGMLGLDFAAKYPEKVDSLILVSLRSQWHLQEIRGLLQEFHEAPETFLKDFYRKCFLGDRDSYRNFCADIEPHYLAEVRKEVDILDRGLRFLGKYSFPTGLPNIPVRLIHGRQDIISPVKEMPGLKGAEVEIIDNCGHIPFLDEKCSLHVELRKSTIREKFSRAAGSYDNYAKVQTEVAGRLAARIDFSREILDVGTILEIGCGTGNFTSLLADKFPTARIIALDFSPEMLEKASRKLGKKNIEFVCTEGEEYLRMARDKSFDLVASNGSLQWFSAHGKALKNIARILVPGGFFCCSIFGPESLKKLGQGFNSLFGYQGNIAAHTFPDVASLQKFLDEYFTEGTSDQELIEKQYNSVHDLLMHIKRTGTGGWHKHGLPPLTASRLRQLDQWFSETFGGCRVTYQVHFLSAIR